MLVRSRTAEDAEAPPSMLPLLRAHTDGSVCCAPAHRLILRQVPVTNSPFGPSLIRSALPPPSPSPVNAVHWQEVGQRLAMALNDPSLLMSPVPSPLAIYARHAPPGLMTPVHVGQWQQVGHRMAKLLGAASPDASPTNSCLMSPHSSVASPMQCAAGGAVASQNSNPHQQLLYSYGVLFACPSTAPRDPSQRSCCFGGKR